jgi:hypothetical protein
MPLWCGVRYRSNITLQKEKQLCWWEYAEQTNNMISFKMAPFIKEKTIQAIYLSYLSHSSNIDIICIFQESKGKQKKLEIKVRLHKTKCSCIIGWKMYLNTRLETLV